MEAKDIESLDVAKMLVEKYQTSSERLWKALRYAMGFLSKEQVLEVVRLVGEEVNRGKTVKKEKNQPPVFPENLDVRDFREAWRQWEKHRSEIRKPLKPTTTQRQLTKLSKAGADVAIQMIDESISNGWTGLFEPEDTKAQTQGADSDYNVALLKELE